jgi:hypothetical protein
MIHNHVFHSRSEPGTCPSAAITPARPAPDESGEGLLSAVFSLRNILGEVVGEAEDGGVMAAAERVKGPPVSLVEPASQVAIRLARVGILHDHLGNTERHRWRGPRGWNPTRRPSPSQPRTCSWVGIGFLLRRNPPTRRKGTSRERKFAGLLLAWTSSVSVPFGPPPELI